MTDRLDIAGIVAAADRAREALVACDRPTLLEAVAAALERERDRIVRTCADETALTPEELAPEFERMTGTLRMFAGLVREGSWVRAAIDTQASAGGGEQGEPGGPGGWRSPIGPGHDVRRMLIPLDGVVAVFGASNFPLAYGVCGGDTASALAAGCPVVVKEHPAHPRTGRLLAAVAREAIRQFDPDLVQDRPLETVGALGYVLDGGADTSVGAALIGCREVAAVGFTGSREGGLALEAIARERIREGERPIPVFAEMGSANRVVVCRHALANRGDAIARELAASILARHGQQCTKPGLISLAHDDRAGPAFVRTLARLLDSAPARRMLSPRVTDQYIERCRRLREVPSLLRATSREDPETHADGERRTVPMLFAGLGRDHGDLDRIQMFTPDDKGYWLNEEIFGPAAIVLGAHDWENLYYADPALVTTVYADEEDLEDLAEPDPSTGERAGPSFPVAHAIRTTGRFTFNTVPTGVRVAAGMVHGGPFPATNRPDTTAVGPFAIERWCRPVCFQNCPDALLPPELRDANPRGIGRLVNGEWTRAPVRRA
jgi:NADP-dependent aldehyde dehydrogenase